MTTDRAGALPAAWRKLFLLELPLVLGTVVFGVLAPRRFLSDAFGLRAADGPTLTLHFSYLGVVGTMVFWFYARLLLAADFHLPTFRRYQEALLLGDVAVVVTWTHAMSSAARVWGGAVAGIALASVWGAVRLVFLLRGPGSART
ncbi:MAG: hypothetical protein JWM10_1245 [Myxococcaceae bacterium]|nr:hypothetical protein [Myxococcaceae bacterium]